MNDRRHPLTGRWLFGVVLIGLGMAWTLDNLGLVDAGAILDWWPALLVLYGASRLMGLGSARSTLLGAFFVAAGSLMLAQRFALVHVNGNVIWPLLLVYLGAREVMRTVRRSRPSDSGPAIDRDDEIHAFSFMGISKRRNQSQAFRGGDLSTVMGIVLLDLRGSKPAEDRVVLDVFACWGGIDVIVPQTWRVELEATPILGGFVDDTHPTWTGTPECTLVLRGVAIMGGISARNEPLSERRVRIVRTRTVDGREVRKEVRVGPEGVTVSRESRPEPPQ
jgi:hypothetical protein